MPSRRVIIRRPTSDEKITVATRHPFLIGSVVSELEAICPTRTSDLQYLWEVVGYQLDDTEAVIRNLDTGIETCKSVDVLHSVSDKTLRVLLRRCAAAMYDLQALLDEAEGNARYGVIDAVRIATSDDTADEDDQDGDEEEDKELSHQESDEDVVDANGASSDDAIRVIDRYFDGFDEYMPRLRRY